MPKDSQNKYTNSSSSSASSSKPKDLPRPETKEKLKQLVVKRIEESKGGKTK